MKWSLKLGQYRGIAVYVHSTFALIIAWVALTYWQQNPNLGFILSGIIFVLAIFACVVLHEFGHALMAQKYGIKTKDIILYPIGGVARLERMPEEPRQELWITLAGPAVNLIIAAAIYLWLNLTGSFQQSELLAFVNGTFMERLMFINILLVFFNMLPAFPMDGGRVLRALLAMRMDYPRATQIAARLGQGMAVLFGVLGVFSNPFLIIIAFFVWMGAAQEAKMVSMRAAFQGTLVDSAMMTRFNVLHVNDNLYRAVEHTLAGAQQDFPVMEEDRLVGVLTRKMIMNALAAQGPNVLVGDVMQRSFAMASAGEKLQSVFNKLQSSPFNFMPIVKNDRLVGLLTKDNIDKFLMIQSALKNIHARTA